MDSFLSKEKLIQKIVAYGSESAESRQVAMRLKRLLPQRIKALKESYKEDSLTVAKASRKALLSKDYEKILLEYLDMKEEAHRSRVMWESYKMYYNARRSR